MVMITLYAEQKKRHRCIYVIKSCNFLTTRWQCQDMHILVLILFVFQICKLDPALRNGHTDHQVILIVIRYINKRGNSNLVIAIENNRGNEYNHSFHLSSENV